MSLCKRIKVKEANQKYENTAMSEQAKVGRKLKLIRLWDQAGKRLSQKLRKAL